MIRINLAILKFFIDDRNSFTIEERKNLGLYQIAKADEIEHQLVSQHNDEVKTDALDTNLISTQTNDQILVNIYYKYSKHANCISTGTATTTSSYSNTSSGI